MSRHHKKNGIPDRWLDYRAVGRRLHGTRFIAFKVPLKQSLNQQVSPSDVFGPWELLDTLKRENQELGLVIDLTFTTRYYKLQDLPESLLFLKIFTAGHEVPSDDAILSFKRAVRRFLRDNADNDKLIGVHCTHGLNRTGYLICRYLIDVDGMDPKEAVELFNSSRGHAIERQNYLKDLQTGPKRSNEGIEDSDQEPQRGCAENRPHYTPLPPDRLDDRRPRSNGSRVHRSFPPRSHPHPPHAGLLPDPLLLPPPPFLRRPVETPFHRYQWRPPPPDSHWRGDLKQAETRSRYPPSEPRWGPASHLQEERRRGLLPPPLPRYSPHWTNQNNSCDGPEEHWGGPRIRPNYEPTHRSNGYDWY